MDLDNEYMSMVAICEQHGWQLELDKNGEYVIYTGTYQNCPKCGKTTHSFEDCEA